MDWGKLRGRLFERETEQSRLLETFERQIEYDSKREFILITGSSGTGKTALASILQRASKMRGGSYITGKLDQFQRAEPYAPFKAAFTTFVNSIIAQGDNLTSTVKKSVNKQVDSMDAALLVNVIPALRLLLDAPDGETYSSSVLGADESQRQKRTTMAFCNIAKAICSPDRPLVIMIDDLQWADTCSLKLISSLVTADDLDGLVLVGTCRNDEVEYMDDLAVLLRTLEDDMNLKVNEFYLKTFDVKRVKSMISDIFVNMIPDSKQPLADLVFKVTNGNIFFILELLKSLEDEGCIYKEQAGTESVWCYDETHMLSTKHAQSVQNLLIDKLKGLSKPVQGILEVAACIGSEFHEKLLHYLIDTTHLSEALDVALRKTLILESDRLGSYKFAHDRIQHAAYSLIPQAQRANYHLTIGRDLHNALRERNELQSKIYLVVNQLQQGIHLVESQDEKYIISELCLQAGEKSIESSDYSTAASYLEFGMAVFGEGHWRHQYQLSLSLFGAAAEVFYCLGKFENINVLVQSVLQNAREVHDKIRCSKTKVLSLVAKHRFDEALALSFSILHELGENSVQDAGQSNLIFQLAKTKALLILKGQKLNGNMKLSRMTDRNKIAIMEMLDVLCLSTLVRDSKIGPIVIFRMIQLTLLHGSCRITPAAFASYGLVMCGLGSFSTGYRFGKLALDSLEQSKSSELQVRVHVALYGLIWDWNQPIRLATKHLQKVLRLGIAGGDIDSAMWGAYHCCVKLSYVAPLEQLANETVSFLEQMKSYDYNSVIPYTKIILQFSHNFMGHSSNPIILTGDVMDEEAVLQKSLEFKQYRLGIAVYINGLVLAFTFNAYERALFLSKKASVVKESNILTFRMQTFIVCILIFYEGLTCIALAKKTDEPKKYREYCQVAKKNISKMKRLAKQVPANCLHKYLLLKAEFDILKGRYAIGKKNYQKAIEFAKKEGFLHEHALACERAGLAFYSCNGAKEDPSLDTADLPGSKFLSEACILYKEWGAHAKVKQMQDLYPFLICQTPCASH